MLQDLLTMRQEFRSEFYKKKFENLVVICFAVQNSAHIPKEFWFFGPEFIFELSSKIIGSRLMMVTVLESQLLLPNDYSHLFNKRAVANNV